MTPQNLFDEEPNAAPSSAPVLRLERRQKRRDKGRARAPEPRPRPEPIPSGPLSVVDQVRLALRPRSRLASSLALLLGGFVPIATYVEAHTELVSDQPLYEQLAALFVAGGLLFSAVTMYGWGRLAFTHRSKALGFVVLLEGVMVTSHTRWLALVALGYLACINGVATACNLARPEVQK
jgi:hypothetical protein